MDLNLILKGQTLEKAKDFPNVVEKSKDYLRIVVDGIPDGFVATAYFRPSWENGKVYNLSMDGNSVVIDEYLTTLPKNPSEYVDYILGVSVVGINANGSRFTTNIVDIILDKTAYSAETENTPEIPQSQYEEVLLQIPSAVENALEVAKESGNFKGEPGEKGDKGDTGERGENGHTPIKGVDYYTAQEKAELVQEIEQAAIGDIDAALDHIIAIQNELIGGGSL